MSREGLVVIVCLVALVGWFWVSGAGTNTYDAMRTSLASFGMPGGAEERATAAIPNAFADLVVNTSEGYSLSPAAIVYYLYLPAGSVGSNQEEMYVLTDGPLLRKLAGFNVAGSELRFSPKPCSSTAEGDFAIDPFFNSREAINLTGITNVCVSNGTYAYDMKIVSYDTHQLVVEK